MKRFSFFKNNDDGASAVEFAIVLPLFLIFVFGIIEFGIIMYNKAMVTNASREGARFGILYIDPAPEDAALFTAVKGKVADKLDTDMDNLDKSRLISLGSSPGMQIDVAFKPSGTKEYLEVKVEYEYAFLIMHVLWSLIPGLSEGSGSLDLSSTTTMRMEYQEP